MIRIDSETVYSSLYAGPHAPLMGTIVGTFRLVELMGQLFYYDPENVYGAFSYNLVSQSDVLFATVVT